MLDRYAEDKPAWCLGCGAAIRNGMLCTRVEEYWLVCPNCADMELDHELFEPAGDQAVA